MQGLNTSDFRGSQVWAGNPGFNPDDEEDSYPYPLAMKVRSRGGSKSGASTPGMTSSRGLSERDLAKADLKLSNVGTNGATNGDAKH